MMSDNKEPTSQLARITQEPPHAKTHLRLSVGLTSSGDHSTEWIFGHLGQWIGKKMGPPPVNNFVIDVRPLV